MHDIRKLEAVLAIISKTVQSLGLRSPPQAPLADPSFFQLPQHPAGTWPPDRSIRRPPEVPE